MLLLKLIDFIDLELERLLRVTVMYLAEWRKKVLCIPGEIILWPFVGVYFNPFLSSLKRETLQAER